MCKIARIKLRYDVCTIPKIPVQPVILFPWSNKSMEIDSEKIVRIGDGIEYCQLRKRVLCQCLRRNFHFIHAAAQADRRSQQENRNDVGYDLHMYYCKYTLMQYKGCR